MHKHGVKCLLSNATTCDHWSAVTGFRTETARKMQNSIVFEARIAIWSVRHLHHYCVQA
jgi:hypothetical protein